MDSMVLRLGAEPDSPTRPAEPEPVELAPVASASRERREAARERREAAQTCRGSCGSW